jgi:hypothetical protein
MGLPRILTGCAKITKRSGRHTQSSNLLRNELVPALAPLYPDPQDPDIPRNTL